MWSLCCNQKQQKWVMNVNKIQLTLSTCFNSSNFIIIFCYFFSSFFSQIHFMSFISAHIMCMHITTKLSNNFILILFKYYYVWFDFSETISTHIQQIKKKRRKNRQSVLRLCVIIQFGYCETADICDSVDCFVALNLIVLFSASYFRCRFQKSQNQHKKIWTLKPSRS